MKRILPFAALLLWAAALAAQEPELLEPERAFVFSVQAAGPERVEVTWDIVPDYYMYRDKFKVRLVSGDVELGELELPPGKKKKDPFFGAMEVYTKPVTLGVPVKRAAGDAIDIVIEAHGQGCNEPVGICYPPLKQTATVQLAALQEDAAGGTPELPPVTSLKSLKDLLSGGTAEPEFLHPDEAFRFDLQVRDGGMLDARFVIAPDYYLYRDKVAFSSETPGVTVATVQLPPGKEKHDEYFGRIEAYYQGFEADVPLLRDAAGALSAVFKVKYQGCAEKGICYPPIEKLVRLELPGVADVAAATSPPVSSPPTAVAEGSGDGFWSYVLTAFVTGIVLTFTPCVLPMVPILSSIIVGQGGEVTKLRGGSLAASYVLGTAVTYTVAGAIAGATGEQLQAYFQNIWSIGTVSVILVLLAFSMFGLYEIQMPAFLQSTLQSRSQRLEGGRLGVVFLLGIISALIVGACVSPLLIVALGVAIVKGDPLLGAAIMFAMALGMGVFLIALGLGAGYLLPKAGEWMDSVKQVFGVLLLGVAIYLLGIIPQVPVLYLWSALFIICAVYLGALQSLPEDANGWRYLWKGAGVFLLVWGVLALVGGMAGNRDVLRPVEFSGASGLLADATGGRPGTHASFRRVASIAELDSGFADARAQEKPLLLDYYADWCIDCLRMEKATFQHPEVAGQLNDRFVLLQVDVTDPGNAFSKAVKRRFSVFGPPAMLFFDGGGEERPELRRYGFMDPDDFLQHISAL
jgi:thiol:disulfide interchange protein DsbD